MMSDGDAPGHPSSQLMVLIGDLGSRFWLASWPRGYWGPSWAGWLRDHLELGRWAS